MKNFSIYFALVCILCLTYACKEGGPSSAQPAAEAGGLKIAFVNGDSILMHYKDFKKQSEAMEIKQRNAEDQLQSKGAALEKEIMAYQQKAQTGTLTGKEMQAREKYLSSRQEAILAERDQMAQEIMRETAEINKRLQSVLQEKLNDIKKREGYDFILSYVEGGPVLVADAKHDITEEVLKQLNAEESAAPAADTTAKK
jgi:Skp family chaperone for outer membrane proteins